MAEDLNTLGFEVDVTLFNVGDIMDLTDDAIPLKERLIILQKGITKGNLRLLPLHKLPEFIEAISAELGKQGNPT